MVSTIGVVFIAYPQLLGAVVPDADDGFLKEMSSRLIGLATGVGCLVFASFCGKLWYGSPRYDEWTDRLAFFADFFARKIGARSTSA